MLMDEAPAAKCQPCGPRLDTGTAQRRGLERGGPAVGGPDRGFRRRRRPSGAPGPSTPDVVAVDDENGLAVIEDSATTCSPASYEAGEPQAPLYLAAVDALARLHLAGLLPEVMPGPGGGWPLLKYDAAALQGGEDLSCSGCPNSTRTPTSARRRSTNGRPPGPRSRPWAKEGVGDGAPRLSRRENLIWLPSAPISAGSG